MLRQLGADAIGMSTVLEAIQARALGLEIAGFSCLTNWAAGMGDGSLSHTGVLETGRKAANEFTRLLYATLSRQMARARLDLTPARSSGKGARLLKRCRFQEQVPSP